MGLESGKSVFSRALCDCLTVLIVKSDALEIRCKNNRTQLQLTANSNLTIKGMDFNVQLLYTKNICTSLYCNRRTVRHKVP